MSSTIINKHFQKSFEFDENILSCIFEYNGKFNLCKYNKWQLIEHELCDCRCISDYLRHMFGNKRWDEYKFEMSVYLIEVDTPEIHNIFDYDNVFKSTGKFRRIMKYYKIKAISHKQDVYIEIKKKKAYVSSHFNIVGMIRPRNYFTQEIGISNLNEYILNLVLLIKNYIFKK